jgi:hypothetical protein
MEQKPLVARFRSIDDISPGDILAMHGLFSGYYENTDIATFIADLSKKSGAILVHEKGGGPLRGFSTITTLPLPEAGENAIGVFSGDTIHHAGPPASPPSATSRHIGHPGLKTAGAASQAWTRRAQRGAEVLPLRRRTAFTKHWASGLSGPSSTWSRVHHR